MSEHLSKEALNADALVLWLDCDREGENICFEVITITQPFLQAADYGGYEGNIFRARFSSLAPADLQHAMLTLAFPNKVTRLAAHALSHREPPWLLRRLLTQLLACTYSSVCRALAAQPTAGSCLCE